MKYKVGDWVVLSEHGAAGWPSRAGLRGQVVTAYPVGDCPYRVEYADIGQWYPFKEEEIELAPVFQGAPQIDFSQVEGEDGAWANETQRVLADDDKRENYPLYDGLFAYFPAALCEVARWSKIGGDKYHPGEPTHWVREKSTDHENKILRHLLDADKEMDDGFVEATALAWRALALCQSILEKRGWAEGANGRWQR